MEKTKKKVYYIDGDGEYLNTKEEIVLVFGGQSMEIGNTKP